MSRRHGPSRTLLSWVLLVTLAVLLGPAAASKATAVDLDPGLDATAPPVAEVPTTTTGEPADRDRAPPLATAGGAAWQLPLVLVAGLVAGVAAGTALHRRARRPGEDAGDGGAALVVEEGPFDASGSPEEAAEAADPSPAPVQTLARPARPDPELPGGVPGVLLLGEQAVQAEEYERAATWFRTALELEPDLAPAHLCLGLCLAELDRQEEALEHLQQAVTLDPQDPVALYQLARRFCLTGHTTEAMDTLEPILLDCPGFADDVYEEEAFRRLRDHPRFLAMLGRL